MVASRNNRKAELPAALERVVSRHVDRGQHLCVALSGGVDSVVLLHATHQIAPSIGCAVTALHVNHRISPNAHQWETFCAEFCQRLGVALSVERIEVESCVGVGVEAAARASRYRAFSRVEADWLLAAHHRGDQAETVLHHLLRGSGVLGAAGIPLTRPLRAAPPLRLLRPLLAVSRERIERYAREYGLSWIEDESNADTRLTRNFLRHRVIPLLRTRYPDCEAALARAAGHFAAAQSLLDTLGEQDLRDCSGGKPGIETACLGALGDVRAANALRVALAKTGGRALSSDRLREMLRQLLESRPDARPVVAADGIAAHRYRGRIHLVWPGALAPVLPVPWRGESVVAWGQGRVLFDEVIGAGIQRSAISQGEWTLRSRQGRERIRLAANRPRRTLKNALQEGGVPPWVRDSMPLLWRDSDLVWAAGVGVAVEFSCPAGEPGLLPRWDCGG